MFPLLLLLKLFLLLLLLLLLQVPALVTVLTLVLLLLLLLLLMLLLLLLLLMMWLLLLRLLLALPALLLLLLLLAPACPSRHLPSSLPPVPRRRVSSMALPLVSTATLVPHEIDHYKCTRLVPAAHRFLTTLHDRHRHTQHSVFLHDLTDSPEFNWKVWVSQRPDAADIVGPGIYRFAFVWVSSTDSTDSATYKGGDFVVQRVQVVGLGIYRFASVRVSRAQPPGSGRSGSNLRDRSGDFLVQRTDGVDIRLHPLHPHQEANRKNRKTKKKEAIPMRGSWEKEWCPETATYLSISPADAVRSMDAIWFLDQAFRVDMGGVPARVSASSQPQFQCSNFVQRRDWFRRHFADLGFSITTFEVAWSHSGKHAVFLGKRNDGRMFTVNPRAPQAKEFSWNTNDIAEI